MYIERYHVLPTIYHVMMDDTKIVEEINFLIEFFLCCFVTIEQS